MTDTPQPAASAETPPKKRSRIKTVLYVLIALIVILAGLWAFGPREPVDTALRFDPAVIGEDIDAYLAEAEARFDDIVEDAGKQVVWAFPASRARTPVAVVYIHGFSASPGEIRPAPDMAAEALGANLFYTRLAGHGRSDEAMAGPTVQDWLDDVAEAVAIGERLGERVVLIGTSTGGTLAAIAALHPDLRGRIAGIVFVSPNFKVQAAGSEILTAPFARQLVPLIVGAQRSFEPENELHARFWTERYPSTALLPMAASVAHANAQFYENTSIPALFVFSDDDSVVDHTATRQIAEHWGGPAEIVAVTESDDPYNHVIAGDALSPSNNQMMADTIAAWVNGL
ncbi:MAG: alpha/beta fold hydrolase [Roseitalea sp.]|jgi:alpha-beta hydrolase superfamily lysophospholipase|nr:alpha/beta fold hydrolase [Roseitalea sp.]MBO6741407.1 alpha/beta fold hydrolase [Roseitalea sp.]